MLDKMFVKEKKKIIIGTDNCNHSIEIGDTAINQGFLIQFPGSTLAIFLYLITHSDANYIVETNPTIIASYLPNTYNLDSIKEGLTYLENHDIIKISAKREGDYTYQIKVNISGLAENFQQNEKITSNSRRLNYTYYNNQQIRSQILNSSNPTRSELFQGILTFVTPDEDISLLETTINQWLEDFDSNMIKELIRRVDKWLKKYNNPPEKGFHYLRGIVDDWYQKEIRSYQGLKHFDKLYRETKELAELYGLPKWHNVKPVHMETFNKWLEEDYPLSIEVVKLAIQEAFQRKKDGQPSLQYIEKNFINPWKRNKVRNCKQARALLKKNSKKKPTQTKENKYAWDDLPWDF